MGDWGPLVRPRVVLTLKCQAVKISDSDQHVFPTKVEKDTRSIVILICSLDTAQIKRRKRPSVQAQRPFNNASKAICHVSVASQT